MLVPRKDSYGARRWRKGSSIHRKPPVPRGQLVGLNDRAMIAKPEYGLSGRTAILGPGALIDPSSMNVQYGTAAGCWLIRLQNRPLSSASRI